MPMHFGIMRGSSTATDLDLGQIRHSDWSKSLLPPYFPDDLRYSRSHSTEPVTDCVADQSHGIARTQFSVDVLTVRVDRLGTDCQ